MTESRKVYVARQRLMARRTIIDWRGNQFLGSDALLRSSLESGFSNLLAERAFALSDFKAYQECPKCGQHNFHLIKSTKRKRVGRKLRSTLIRECSECGFEWEQS